MIGTFKTCLSSNLSTSSNCVTSWSFSLPILIYFFFILICLESREVSAVNSILAWPYDFKGPLKPSDGNCTIKFIQTTVDNNLFKCIYERYRNNDTLKKKKSNRFCDFSVDFYLSWMQLGRLLKHTEA